MLGQIRLSFNEKALKKHDYKMVKRAIRKGDVFIVGNLKVASRVLMRGPLTHATIYTGGGQFYHSIAHGVERISLKQVFKIYDTCVLLRPSYSDKRSVVQSVKFIKLQKGKPYNFDTGNKRDSYYCTELVRDSLVAGCVDVKLPEHKSLLSSWSYVDPMDFLEAGMEVIYHSSNLKVEGGKARRVGR